MLSSTEVATGGSRQMRHANTFPLPVPKPPKSSFFQLLRSSSSSLVKLLSRSMAEPSSPSPTNPSFRETISRGSSSFRRALSVSSGRLSPSPHRSRKERSLSASPKSPSRSASPARKLAQDSLSSDLSDAQPKPLIRNSTEPITFMLSRQPSTTKAKSRPRHMSAPLLHYSSAVLEPIEPILTLGHDLTPLNLPNFQNNNVITIPLELTIGVPMDRVTHKKRVERVIRLNKALLQISWDPKKSSSRFIIDDIASIYVGQKASYYQNELGKVLSETDKRRWITVVYAYHEGKKIRELHVIAKSDEDFRMFVDTIESLWKLRQSCDSLLELPPQILRNEWANLNAPEIEFDRLLNILKFHDIVCPPQYVNRIHNQVNGGRPLVNCDEFVKFISILGERPEIQRLWSYLCNSADGMSFEDFVDFCRDTQKMKNVDFKALFAKYSNGSQYISSKALSEFLMSDEDCALISTIDVDLNHPITSYFISSSHNTYLPNRQVLDNTSAEPYVRQLLDGCRCVEIDVWDGVDMPMVGHHVHVSGVHMSMTNETKLKTVLLAINEFAFVSSDLPVILSFEIRCGEENQRRVAQSLKEVFGDKLVTKDINVEGDGSKNIFTMPQVSQLRNKILIKVKATTEMPNGRNLGLNIGAIEEPLKAVQLSQINSPPSPRKPDIDTIDVVDGKAVKKVKKSKVIVHELGSLGVYLMGLKFKSFSSPDCKTPNHCFSFSEAKINKIIANGIGSPSPTSGGFFTANGSESDSSEDLERSFIKHNTKYFTRVYPDKTRVRSTNFDPIPYWRRGVQMAALNWQTYDVNTQINEAMFAGSNGYLLKPDFDSPAFSGDLKAMRLNVSILSLWHVPPQGWDGADSYGGSSYLGNSYTFTVSIELYGVVERKERLKVHHYKVLSKTSTENVSKHDRVWTTGLPFKSSIENPLAYLPLGVGTDNEANSAHAVNRSSVAYTNSVTFASTGQGGPSRFSRRHNSASAPERPILDSSSLSAPCPVVPGNTWSSGEINLYDWEFTFLRFVVRAHKHDYGEHSMSGNNISNGVNYATDDGGDIIGQYTVKAKNLQEGYRHIPLKDFENECEYKHARILVWISKDEIVNTMQHHHWLNTHIKSKKRNSDTAISGYRSFSTGTGIENFGSDVTLFSPPHSLTTGYQGGVLVDWGKALRKSFGIIKRMFEKNDY